MERHDGEDKNGSSEALFGEDSRGRAKEKGYQARGKSQWRNDYSNNECYCCKKKGHIQMMCKEMKEDLKKIKDLKVGRRDGESSRSAALGFVDDDYNGALLIDGGVTRSKEWVIDSGCSFHICCEKEKFAKLSYVDGGLVTLLNDERVKVEGIGEVVIVTHDGVKRRLGGVRYVPKLERNLISLGRLESKGCTFKASGGLLNVITGSMVLIRGRRSESNSYMLQVDGGCLGHIDDGCKSPKKVTFDNGKGIGLEKEIVESRANSHNIDDDFEHLVAHAMSCTLESSVGCVMANEVLRFGSLDQVLHEDDLKRIDQGMSRGKYCSAWQRHSRRPGGTVEGCSTVLACVARSSGLSSFGQLSRELARLVEHYSSGRAGYRTTH
ncbi:uncharacterized protein LOC130826654 [Amaranthus tricolor]|uniref:uncharacterized protein LOC130826654 n=1 Tax=Amaranthus tricolor TaxID=29722 RepID=UPI002587E4A9|nr:uncharacterized protein LOC130826654 [Amaranthus tricolor]